MPWKHCSSCRVQLLPVQSSAVVGAVFGGEGRRGIVGGGEGGGGVGKQVSMDALKQIPNAQQDVIRRLTTFPAGERCQDNDGK